MCFKEVKKIYRRILRERINDKNIKKLTNSNFTIICSNCLGGIIYHDLRLRFNSPTINLYFESKDFIKFCKNLKHYIEGEVELLGYKENYPVIKIDDIKIYAVHYKTFEEFEEKWNKRKGRINYDNIYIFMTERDGCTYEDIINFDKLEYRNKVIFVHKDMPEIDSAYYIKGSEIENEVRPLMEYKGKFTGKRIIDDFDYVDFLNSKVNNYKESGRLNGN